MALPKVLQDVENLKSGNMTIGGTKTFSSPVNASVTKLTNPVTINGVSFDGSANITVVDSTAIHKTGNETAVGTKTFSGTLIDKQGYEIIGVPNTAAAHNGIYRGKDLTNVYTVDQICNKVSANDWSDLFIGDYITKTFTNPSGNSETADFVFAGFDYWLNMGAFYSASRNNGYTDYPTNGATTNHHIVIVPKDCFSTTSYMNSTNTTENGYFGSYMCQTTLKNYATRLNASGCFNGKIRTFCNWTNSKVVTTYPSMAGANFQGCTVWEDSNGYAWTCHKLSLLSEPMVYGGAVFGSSGYDVGCGKAQLPLFSLSPQSIKAGLGRNGGRYYWWLSAVASSAYFAHVNDDGAAHCNSASSSFGVRPFFLIG